MPIHGGPENGDAELASFDAVTTRSNILEYLRKESSDIFNRLHSIAEDSAFVEHVHQVYPTIPLLGKAYSQTAVASRLTSMWS
jgi:Rit1 N-terminal domain